MENSVLLLPYSGNVLRPPSPRAVCAAATDAIWLGENGKVETNGPAVPPTRRPRLSLSEGISNHISLQREWQKKLILPQLSRRAVLAGLRQAPTLLERLQNHREPTRDRSSALDCRAAAYSSVA